MSDAFDLSGKVALVTGASQGLGRRFAAVLAEHGAVVGLAARQVEKLQDLEHEIVTAGGRAASVALDITALPAIEQAFERVEQALGPVDVLVNNAGTVSLSGGILQETAAAWDNVIETQLNAVFLLSKLVAASMAQRRRGKIINIGSMYSYFGSALIPSYSAAKGAVIQLTKSMAIELAPHGIQVNAIAPGWIETDMTAAVRTDAMKAMNDEIVARTPAGRWGLPEDVAGAAVFLASHASDFVTGETIRVDGGYAIR
jgi:2-deoxy-D-gluconate 3-dehydrogenase